MRPDAPADTLVGAYVNALLNACATTLSTITKVAITLELEPPLRDPSEALVDSLPLPWFVAYARFTRGLSGVHQLVLAQRDVASLGQLLLGEGSSEATLSPEQEEKIHDVVNRTFGSVSSALRGFFGRPITLTFADHQRVETAESFHAHAVALAVGNIMVDGAPRARFALAVPPAITGPADATGADTGGGQEAADPSAAPGLDVILDIAMPLTVELGRTKMLIRDILALGPGSVIELDKLAGEPVELLVNDRPIAKGEVVVIDENFGVRLTQISHATERLRSLS
jgi:flagellar motor switch protein FliN